MRNYSIIDTEPPSGHLYRIRVDGKTWKTGEELATVEEKRAVIVDFMAWLNADVELDVVATGRHIGEELKGLREGMEVKP